jgi:GNAT superfamily N-acetyltransferase
VTERSPGSTRRDEAALVIEPEAFDSAVAQELVAAVQQEYVRRYGGPDETPIEPGEFDPPSGVFVVGRRGGAPVASGALRRLDDQTAEVKRMYVAPEARRQGVARAVLAYLEKHARSAGVARLVLETGDEQPEALAFYTAAGYRPVTPYGFYRCYPDAHSLGKDLVVADAKDVANEGMYA